MPSVLLNSTLSSLSSGVTQQYQEGRFDSQVSEMINCMPSITRGVLRRNPINKIAVLTGLPVDITNCFVYSYDRGTGTEQYIVIIPGDGSIHVYNANDGSFLYTTTGNTYLQVAIGEHAKEAFKAITIGDSTFIVNSGIVPAFTAATAPTAGYADMAFYWVKKTTSVVLLQKQTLDTTVTPNITTSGSLSQGYTYTLNGTTIIGTTDTRPYYAWSSVTTYSAGTVASYGGVNYIALRTTLNDLPPDNPLDWKIYGDVNTSKKIAEEFVAQSVSSLATKVEGSVCYNDTFSGSDWQWEDTFGNEASIGVWKTVDSSDELPVSLPEDLDGFIVEVSGGTTGEFDNYYLKYDYAGRTWKETVKPGALTTLNAATMPHVLYRLADGSFTFNTFQGVISTGLALDGVSKWGERVSGGGDTLQDPSFIGKTISNIFFHKNRVGFITKDSIVLSQTSDYGKFFPQTIQEVLDDDPIDLAVASTDVTVLRHAVSTSGQLILFSDDTQFSLVSLEGALTPKTAEITPLSNYTYGEHAPAKSIGNRVFFTNQAGGYSQLYSYKITDQGSRLTEANPMTLHLPSYIDKSASRIIGHDVLGQIFIEVEDFPKELIVLTSVEKGGKELQNAFHKWTFEKDIVSTHIINNDLYILFSDGTLNNMSLEIPGSIEAVTYLDEYDTLSNYPSSIIFSEFFVRDAKGQGTVRGRYQLRTLQYTITDNSKYITNIYSTDQALLDPETMYGPTWDDSVVWDDTLIWVDIDPLYYREYTNDDKVTVMANSKKVVITFKSSTVEPSKGFELATANIEAFQHQRSTRK